MTNRYEKAMELANQYLEEDDAQQTQNNSQITGLQKNRDNLIAQKTQLQDKMKQLNIQIAKLDEQIANLGGNT
jgi:chromosome segregation ATPase